MNNEYISALEKIKLSDEFKNSAAEKLKKLQKEQNEKALGGNKYNVSEFRTAETVDVKSHVNKPLKIALMSVAGAAAIFACVFGAVKLSEYYSTTPDVQSATETDIPSITTSHDIIDVDSSVVLSLDKTIYISADEYGTLMINNGVNSKVSPMFVLVAGIERFSEENGEWEETEYSQIERSVSAAFRVYPGKTMENTIPIADIYAKYGAGRYRVVKNDVSGDSPLAYTAEFAITEATVSLSLDRYAYLPADTVGTLSISCVGNSKISLAEGVTIEQRRDDELTVWENTGFNEGEAATIELLAGERYELTVPVGELYAKYGEGTYRVVKQDFESALTYTAEFDILSEMPTLPMFTCDGYSNTSLNYAIAIIDDSERPVENPTLSYGTTQLSLTAVKHNAEGVSINITVNEAYSFLVKRPNGNWMESDCGYISTDAVWDFAYSTELSASLWAEVPDVHNHYSEAPLPVGEYMLVVNIDGQELYVRFNISSLDSEQLSTDAASILSAELNAGKISVYSVGEAPNLSFAITNNSDAVFYTNDRQVQLIFGDNMMNATYYFDIPMPESIQPNESVSFTPTADMLTCPYWFDINSPDAEYYLNMANGYGSFAAGNYTAQVIFVYDPLYNILALGESKIGILDENGKLYCEADYDIYSAMGGKLEAQTEKSEYTLAEIGSFVRVYYQNMKETVISCSDISLIEKQNADGSWTLVENENPVSGPIPFLIIRSGKTVLCTANGTITQTGHYRVRLDDMTRFGIDSSEEVTAEFDVIDGESVCDIPTYTADGYSNTSKHFAAAFTDGSGNYTECPKLTYGGDVRKLNYAVAVKRSDGLDDAVFTGTTCSYYVKNSDGQWADCGYQRDSYSKTAALSKSGKSLALTAVLSYYENSDSSEQIPLPVGEYILVKEVRNGEATEMLYLRFDIVKSSVYDEMPLTTVDGLSNKSAHFMAAAYDGSLNYSECPRISYGTDFLYFDLSVINSDGLGAEITTGEDYEIYTKDDSGKWSEGGFAYMVDDVLLILDSGAPRIMKAWLFSCDDGGNSTRLPAGEYMLVKDVMGEKLYMRFDIVGDVVDVGMRSRELMLNDQLFYITSVTATEYVILENGEYINLDTGKKSAFSAALKNKIGAITQQDGTPTENYHSDFYLPADIYSDGTDTVLLSVSTQVHIDEILSEVSPTPAVSADKIKLGKVMAVYPCSPVYSDDSYRLMYNDKIYYSAGYGRYSVSGKTVTDIPDLPTAAYTTAPELTGILSIFPKLLTAESVGTAVCINQKGDYPAPTKNFQFNIRPLDYLSGDMLIYEIDADTVIVIGEYSKPDGVSDTKYYWYLVCSAVAS